MTKLLSIIILLLLTIDATAQTGWKWGKRGGASVGFKEGNTEMVTDAQGNLYVLASMDKGTIAYIDSASSLDNNTQLSLSKWDCSGNHIWTKFFGGTGSISAISSSLAIDSLGGIYFTGKMLMAASTPSGPETVYFDTDLPAFYTVKQWYIAKYDTAGVFQWLELPQADSVTFSISGTAHKSAPIGLDATPNGDVFILAHLAPGIFSDSCISTELSAFRLMRYNKDGEFLDAKEVDMSVSINDIGTPVLESLLYPTTNFVRDHRSGRFYISGSYNNSAGDVIFGSTPISATDFMTTGAWPMYLTAFDSEGNHLWVEQTDSTLGVNPMYTRPGIDDQGNIYICGNSEHGNTLFGHTMTNSYTGIYSGPNVSFLLSVDSSGNLRWAKNAGSGNLSGLKGLSYFNGIVSVSDGLSYFLSWGADTIITPPTDFLIHLSRFNAHTGSPVKNIDTFTISGAGSGTTDLIADHRGNIYLGGRFATQVILPSITLNSLGGTFDFFVAKYGSDDCDCILPTLDFSYTSTIGSNTISFMYTGTIGVDSIRWEFGDGAMASGFTASHTYASAGTYGVSIVVYDACGIQVFYKEITIDESTGINVNGLNSNVVIYPNPTQSHITIEKAEIGTEITIYNNIGQQMIPTVTIFSEKQNLDVSALSNGVYIIHFQTQGNKTGTAKFIKK